MVDRPLRVLLVDDHALVRAAVATTLAEAGIQVVGEAATASEGLERALELSPDIVVLDIDLPGEAGLAIIRELVSRLPQSRVVMLTVSTAHAHLVAAISSGASGYLTKDMSPEALVRAIRGVAAGDVAMSRQATTALARESGIDPQPHPSPLTHLTPRERQILELLGEGRTDRTIGETLGISPRTVETHVSNIVDKLRVPNRAAAVATFRGSGGDWREPGGRARP